MIARDTLVLRKRLGSGASAKVPQMKMTLDRIKKAVKVTVRKYLSEQIRFLDAYLGELVKIGVFKDFAQASYQEAPHLLRKGLKGNYLTTIYLCLVNFAANGKQLPMPMTEADLSKFSGSKKFASLD